jgi:hypothetical protein
MVNHTAPRREKTFRIGAVGLCSSSLKGGSFHSVQELITHITSFIADYNDHARPFVWTKSVVHQKRMKPCFAV